MKWLSDSFVCKVNVNFQRGDDFLKRYMKWLCALCALFVLLGGIALAEEECGIGEAATIILPGPQENVNVNRSTTGVSPATVNTSSESGVSPASTEETPGVAGAYTAYANEDSIKGFVYRMYKVALGREPEPEGFLFWVNKLESGELKAADLVQGFLGSEEYQSLGKNNEQIVTDCYRVMLNREPDAEGLKFWKNRIDTGMTYQSVCCGFVDSVEFINLAAQYGVIPGKIKLMYARDQDYDRTAFVYRLYVDCLERAPETAGLEHWCQMLQNGMSGTNVASGFVFSPEYKNRLTSNEDYVEMLYRTILGRGSEPNGKNHWVNLLDYTNTREHLLNGFMSSAEFAQKCSQASVKVGKPIYEPDNDREWKANVLVLSLVNAERQKAGLAPLKTREDLWERAAMVRAKEVRSSHTHTRPDGTPWYYVYDDAGFAYYKGAENIAWGYRTEQAVMNAWMNSKGHRENILANYLEYLATGLYRNAYWSQNFITLFP